MKKRVNISVDADVWERMQEYAAEQHATASAVITQWILRYAKVKDPQLRGQMSLDEYTRQTKNRG